MQQRRPTAAPPATAQENDALLRALLRDAKDMNRAFKGHTQELQLHMSLLDSLQGGLGKAATEMRRLADRVKVTASSNEHYKHMWVLFGFVFVVVVFIWLMLKR